MNLLSFFSRIIWNDPLAQELPEIKTSLYFYQRLDLYVKEKPYLFEFPIDSNLGVPRTNTKLESKEIIVRDIRGYQNLFSVDNNGFELTAHETRITQQDFEKIAHAKFHNPLSNETDGPIPEVTKYNKEIEALLTSRFKASRVVVFSCIVR